MCDSLPSTLSLFAVVKLLPLRFSFSYWEPKPRAFSSLSTSICSNGCNSDELGFGNCRPFRSFKPNHKLVPIFCAVGSQNGRFDYELGLEEEGASRLQFESNESDSTMNDRRLYGDAMESHSLDFLESKDEFKEGKGNGQGVEGLEEKINMVQVEDSDSEIKESRRYNGEIVFRRKRLVMRRSGILAKQIISIQSARSLGFVSQLWVDATAWMVIYLEVKPNLLSGESEWFLLEDVTQVGDVVLIQDETVIENEFKMIGLETLVGYKVVTPGLRTIGKIRGYSFNINSGAVESLELDSFGISIIPSTLISTYSLLVEDVLEVLSDSVVVDEAAASRIQRLSRGFLGTQNVGNSRDADFREYGEAALSGRRWRKKRSSNRQQQQYDWDYPKDYL